MKDKYKITWQILFLVWTCSSYSFAQSKKRLVYDTKMSIVNKINPLLEKYCGTACQIINTEVEVGENLPDVDNLGFEGTDDSANEKVNYFVKEISVQIEIDRRMTEENREKLAKILNNHIKTFSLNTHIYWMPVEVPQIGFTGSMSQATERKLHNKIKKSTKSILNEYCPENCLLTNILIDSELITLDEVKNYRPEELVYSDADHTVLHIKNIDVHISMDDDIPELERNNILSLIEAKNSYVKPIVHHLNVVSFPETFRKKKLREKEASQDPFGLEKLKQMLLLFRDFASTKEIITRSEVNKTLKEDSKATLENNEKTKESMFEDYTWAYILAGIALFSAILFFIVLKFSQANKDARMMVHAINENKTDGDGAGTGGKTGGLMGKDTKESSEDVLMSVHFNDLKEELIQIFINNPKVAKETFSRLLQEAGVEETAKYVYIFGKMIVFELLSDPSLQMLLYDLTEYYQKTTFSFKIKEKIELLEKLKIKVTANEIRVLSSKAIDQFDFLLKLDPGQVFHLMADESPKVQSIVLTQLTRKKRRLIFDMFEGKGKLDLMNELCKADAIPREYLYNVAMALSKKVTSKPEFDTQSLRSSDIILELLEKASLTEQRNLMSNLYETNPESARAIKLKLVTIEILPFLKDGHLLELILGMEREELLAFLTGSPDHISSLLLTRAPEELAESWREDLESISSVDDEKYRMVELKIISKIRQLAGNGAISLLEINDMIFKEDRRSYDEQSNLQQGSIDPSNLVA